MSPDVAPRAPCLATADGAHCIVATLAARWHLGDEPCAACGFPPAPDVPLVPLERLPREATPQAGISACCVCGGPLSRFRRRYCGPRCERRRKHCAGSEALPVKPTTDRPEGVPRVYRFGYIG